MPKKSTKALRATQGTGNGTEKRSEGQKAIRVRRKDIKDATPIIANSIYQLALKPKKGPEVFQALNAFNNKYIDFKVMYNDLYAAYKAARKILLCEETFDVANAGINIALSLYHYIHEFKKLLPADFEADIHHDDDGKHFFFQVHKECSWNYGWSCFEIKDVVRKLRKQSGPLHNLFLSFLKSFCISTGVDFWWNNFMGATLDMLDENVENMRGEYEDQEVMQAEIDLKNYTEGEAFSYQQTIRNASDLKPQTILKRLEQFRMLRSAQPIIELIRQGCAVMDGNHLAHFNHPELTNDEYYLDLYSQTNVLWDSSDTLSYDHEQSLDANAQEGVQMPKVILKVDGAITEINWAEIEEKSKWPQRLTEFFVKANQLILEFKSSEKLISILSK
jgi:hypothetical protein